MPWGVVVFDRVAQRSEMRSLWPVRSSITSSRWLTERAKRSSPTTTTGLAGADLSKLGLGRGQGGHVMHRDRAPEAMASQAGRAQLQKISMSFGPPARRWRTRRIANQAAPVVRQGCVSARPAANLTAPEKTVEGRISKSQRIRDTDRLVKRRWFNTARRRLDRDRPYHERKIKDGNIFVDRTTIQRQITIQINRKRANIATPREGTKNMVRLDRSRSRSAPSCGKKAIDGERGRFFDLSRAQTCG